MSPGKRFVALLMLASATALACGGSSSSTTQASASPELQKVVDAARKEGAKLDLTWGSYLTDQSLQRGWVEGFDKTYGLDLQMTVTPEPQINVGAAKMVQEFKAGRRAPSDVFLTTETNYLPLMAAGVPDQVDWKSFAPNLQNTRTVEDSGGAVRLLTTFRGITFNSDKIKGAEVPKTTADVLALARKYPVAATPQASTYDALATPDIWGSEKTLAYVNQLSPLLKGLINGNEVNRISTGEFYVFMYDYGKDFVDHAIQQGQPLGWALPTDAATQSPIYVTVPKNATHPNAARLFVNYVLSRAAQDLLYKYQFVDNDLLPGSHQQELIKSVSGRGVHFTVTDIAFASRNQDTYAKVRPQLQAILQRK